MINDIEKLEILNNKILELDREYTLTLEYIDMINNGMEDPDLPLEYYQNKLPEILIKKQSIIDYKNSL